VAWLNTYLKNGASGIEMLVTVSIPIIVILVLAVLTRTEHMRLTKYIPRKRRVVCSLTTRPVQPRYFDKVLDRLVEQFDAVYLALPAFSSNGVPYPEFHHSGVTVIPVEEDYGPITKFFGVLNSDEKPGTLVVVLDDDIIYDRGFRDIYEKAHVMHPGCVLSGAGIVHKYLHASHVPWFLAMTGRKEHYPTFFPSFLGDKSLTTVAGYTGICFKRGLIQREELLVFMSYWNRHRECFVNDDLVFSAFLSTKGIPRLGIRVPRCVIEPDKGAPNLSGVENVGTWGMWPALWPMQRKVMDRLRDCFRNDPVRYDCICLFDVLVVAILVAAVNMWGRAVQHNN
jgi:hypothetical protein